MDWMNNAKRKKILTELIKDNSIEAIHAIMHTIAYFKTPDAPLL
ncbi:hypothetical protein [Marivirga harenae]|nr:hypothetical protein [Marivirga harenae]WKV12270.1 hypothetical protein Q3Y49_00260 [Marivirga harenae]